MSSNGFYVEFWLKADKDNAMTFFGLLVLLRLKIVDDIDMVIDLIQYKSISVMNEELFS